jgi:hypothetical protein
VARVSTKTSSTKKGLTKNRHSSLDRQPQEAQLLEEEEGLSGADLPQTW